MTAATDPIHVLIVDDDYEDYQITRDLLLASSFDYRVELARTYDDGVAALQRMSYDICLIDYHLGHRDGVELIAAFHDAGSPHPMILLTGEQDPELGLRASAAGAADFLSKNEITPRKLDRCIRYSLERARAGQHKRHTRELLSAALNAIAGHVAILDEKGVVIAVNAGWQRMAQAEHLAAVAPEVGRNFLDLNIERAESISGEPLLTSDLVRQVISGEIVEGRAQYPVGPSGSQRWFAMRVTRFLEDKAPRVMIFNTDVTERKLVEDAANRLAAIVKHSADAIFGLEPDGRITSWNAAAEKLFGYSESEIQGRDVRCLESAAGDGGIAAILPRVLSGEAVDLGETEMLSEDGKLLTVSCICSPVYNARNQVTGVSGIVRDLSHQKSLEQQLWHSQKMEAIGELTGGIAHDFNNILTVINGHADSVKQAIEPGRPGYREIQQLAEAGERAASLTRQLLAFGRKQIFRVEVADLNHVVLQLRSILESLIRDNIRLNFNLSATPVPVKVDVNRVGQVLMNLVINARDAMPAGGELEIGTRCAPAETNGSGRGENGTGRVAVLTVTDTGTGIAPEIRDRIFEPFFTTKEAGKGTGLGLSVVYGIVNQSGGRISIDSEMGFGTTFTITLPSCEESRPEAVLGNRSAESADMSTAAARILLVEEDENVREYAAGVLRDEGHTVYEAADGTQGWDLAEALGHEIDLLVVDSAMRGKGEANLANELLNAMPRLRVLYVSGQSGESIVAAPGRDILEKPFTPRALRRQVKSILAPAMEAGLAEKKLSSRSAGH